MTDPKPSFLSAFPPVVLNLLVINSLFWLASITLPRIIGLDVNYTLGLHYWQANDFHAYQLLTYMFLHASFDHIFFNMFGLFMFGPVLEQVWGSRRFLFYYLFTGIGAALTQEATWTTSIYPYISQMGIAFDSLGIHPLTVGASGAVFGILLAFAMTFPNEPMFLLFLPIPIKAKYMIPAYAVLELFMGIAPSAGDNIAHFAHLGGALFGLILILIWKRSARNRKKFF
jgi:membrane associated rhomboid family serine protease